jgi:hypothetical protein
MKISGAFSHFFYGWYLEKLPEEKFMFTNREFLFEPSLIIFSSFCNQKDL